MSELLVLHLTKRIPYAKAEAENTKAARESIEIYRFSDIFDFSPAEGPEASLPGPSSLLASGYLCENDPEPSFYLDSGDYLFKQESESPGFDLRAALRDYARDAWWESRRIGGKLILRRVFEDGKRSLQFLSPLIA
jgi:hypothetical protein